MDLPLVGNSSPIAKKSASITGNLNSDASPEDAPAKSAETPPGPESPDMQTAAERFAKQNQCTLKKNTKLHIDSCEMAPEADVIAITSPMPERKYATIGSTATTTTFKPQFKSKPPVLKKPAFPVPAVTPDSRLDHPDLPT